MMRQPDAVPAWRADLRALLATRGERLRVLAALLVPGSTSDAGDALGDALVDAFSARRAVESPGRGTGRRGGVTLRTDADLDPLEAAVRHALVRRTTLEAADASHVLEAYCRLQPARAAVDLGVRERDVHRMLEDARAADEAGFDARSHDLARRRARADAVDDADDDADTAQPGARAGARTAELHVPLGDLVRRVRVRRRARIVRAAVAGGAAAVVVVAGVAWGAGVGPWHASDGSVAASTDSAAPEVVPLVDSATARPAVGAPELCGGALDVSPHGVGPVTLALRDPSGTIAGSSTWTGRVSVSAADVESAHLDLVGPLQIVVLGGPAGDEVAAVGEGDVPAFDLPTELSEVVTAVRFPGCGQGTALGPGTYSVVAVQQAVTRTDWPGGSPITLESAPVKLTVARSAPATDAVGRPAAQQPTWLAGTPVACGMAEDALALLPQYFPTYLTVSSANRGPWIGVQIRNVAGGPAPVPTGVQMAVAWSRDGAVVSVGANELARARTAIVPGDSQLELRADLADTRNTCSPASDGRYTKHLPPGTYTATPYARIGGPGTSYRNTLGWFVGLPATVTIDASGVPHVR
jgi:hypothetical protein